MVPSKTYDMIFSTDIPVDTGRKLNVHKTSYVRSVYILCLRGCIILTLSSPWKDAGEEAEISLFLQLFAQRNQNVGINSYQLTKLVLNVWETNLTASHLIKHLHCTIYIVQVSELKYKYKFPV